MLQEGPKNLNQGSLATWAKMAGSWFAVCFKVLLECAERKTVIGFVRLTCDLLKVYTVPRNCVSVAIGRNDLLLVLSSIPSSSKFCLLAMPDWA